MITQDEYNLIHDYSSGVNAQNIAHVLYTVASNGVGFLEKYYPDADIRNILDLYYECLVEEDK